MSVAFDGTPTVAGRVPALVLLDKATSCPLFGTGMLTVTLHAPRNDPATDTLAQLRLVSCGWFWAEIATGQQPNRSGNGRTVPRTFREPTAVLVECGRKELLAVVVPQPANVFFLAP